MVLRRPPRHCCGFTLTEFVIVLGIIGLIIGAIWEAAGYVYNSSKLNDTVSDFAQISNNYISLYQQHGVDIANPTNGDIGTDVTCMGVTAGLFPAKTLTQQPCSILTQDTSYPQTPYGSPTYFIVEARQEPAGVVVEAFGLTQTQCINLATVLFHAANVIWEQIGAGTYRWLSIVNTQSPFNTTQIETGCAGGASVQVMYQVKG